MAPFDVPEVVRNRALAAGAEHWLDALPERVARLERDWSIAVGRAYEGGTESFVAEATRSDGTPAVLKLLMPHGGASAAHEITVLRLVDGEGCARLLDHDLDCGAMLLERLGPKLYDLGLPVGRRHEILCEAASRVWRPAAGQELPTGAEKARWLGDFIASAWEELDRPCSERAVAHALACADRRLAAHDDERAVLVHGDVHEWNALATDDGGFKLVDPDGLLAEAEYDLGVLMREDPVELMAGDPRERARRLAGLADLTGLGGLSGLSGLDAEAIWEWGVAERVSTGLLATRIDLQPVGRDMLAAADRVAAG